MSLATQCPHCHTTFKVANDQLKLRSGLVRCGMCQHVFNGLDYLIDTSTAAASSTDAFEDHTSEPSLSALSFEATIPSNEPVLGDAPTTLDDDIGASSASETDNIEQLTFIRQANTKKRALWFFSVGTLVLLLLLIGQATYQFRNIIAGTYAPIKQTLITLCSYARCQIQLPAQLDAISYEADELQTLPRENTFEFGLLMHNHSSLTQAWPHIELTLKNTQKQTVLKRVFSPSDYLTNPIDIQRGFPANQEQAVKLYFELVQLTAQLTAQLPASDYTVAVFYP